MTWSPSSPTASASARGEARITEPENVPILKLLICWEAGVMTTVEFIERVRDAVPDPLAE